MSGVSEMKVMRGRVPKALSWGRALMSLKIIHVDDHRLAGDSIRVAMRFHRHARPEIIGEAADGRRPLMPARQFAPDVDTTDVGPLTLMAWMWPGNSRERCRR